MGSLSIFRLTALAFCVGLRLCLAQSQSPLSLDPEGELQTQINRLDKALAANPESPRILQARGETHFFLGRINESIADFNRVIELIPSQEARHWQRGISYYYAREFEKGVAQFELHQTVNSQDVENAVWHFLCKSKLAGIPAARASLIPISRDYRSPMSEIWALFAGRGSPESVLAAAQKNQGKQSLCYAHLYLGLYFESSDQPELALKHIRLAATDYFVDNYMGRVARTHLWLRETQTER